MSILSGTFLRKQIATATIEVHKNHRRYSELCYEERNWTDRTEFLEKHGYSLRPRYQPKWRPSWMDADGNGISEPSACEDSIWIPDAAARRGIDAKCLDSGRVVYIKVLGEREGQQHLEVLALVSSQEMRENPSNHCVPILRHLENKEQFGRVDRYLVMPFLRAFDDPPFSSVGDVLDFMQQTLEGLAFLHRHGIAHRDISAEHVRMDATALYPNGFHPVKQDLEPSTLRKAAPMSRSSANVVYLFTEFEAACRFENATLPLRVCGIVGQDRSIPELSNIVPYDPFPVDVCALGNLLRNRITEKYSQLDFLDDTVCLMTKQQARERATAEGALSLLRNLKDHTFRTTPLTPRAV